MSHLSPADRARGKNFRSRGEDRLFHILERRSRALGEEILDPPLDRAVVVGDGGAALGAERRSARVEEPDPGLPVDSVVLTPCDVASEPGRPRAWQKLP